MLIFRSLSLNWGTSYYLLTGTPMIGTCIRYGPWLEQLVEFHFHFLGGIPSQPSWINALFVEMWMLTYAICCLNANPALLNVPCYVTNLHLGAFSEASCLQAMLYLMMMDDRLLESDMCMVSWKCCRTSLSTVTIACFGVERHFWVMLRSEAVCWLSGVSAMCRMYQPFYGWCLCRSPFMCFGFSILHCPWVWSSDFAPACRYGVVSCLHVLRSASLDGYTHVFRLSEDEWV